MSLLNALSGSDSSAYGYATGTSQGQSFGSSLGNASSSSENWTSTMGSGALATAQSAAMMEKANEYNKAMFEAEKAFNAEQAELNRQFQERMSNSAYQRTIADLKAAKINPILAAIAGGSSTPTGSAASAKAASSAMGNAYTDMESRGSSQSKSHTESKQQSNSTSHSKSENWSESASGLLTGLEAIAGAMANLFGGGTEETTKEPEGHTSQAGINHGGGGTRQTENHVSKSNITHGGGGTRPGGTYKSTFTVKNNRSHEDMANPKNISKSSAKNILNGSKK